MVKLFFRSLVAVSVWQVMLIIGRGFFCGWCMEPFDERVLVELFSKRFSYVFFCNGGMNIFDDMSFFGPARRGFLAVTARKDVLYFLFQDLSVFFWVSVNCYIPFGKGICVFYINIFEERSLIHFFISAELFGFISWGILSISLMFVSFLIVQTKSTEVWSFDRNDISSLSVLVFCLLSID